GQGTGKGGGGGGGNKPAQPTAAKPPKPPGMADAAKHYAEGEKKFKAGDYQTALTEFQAADQIKPTPHAAPYIGLSLDQLAQKDIDPGQKFHDAAAAYERFLGDPPKNMAAQIDEVKARVAVIKALPGTVHVETTPPGASITVDGKASDKPTPADLQLPPGK